VNPRSVLARVAAARDLLEEGADEEHGSLPPECRANLQEAIEFLIAFEEEFDGDEGKK